MKRFFVLLTIVGSLAGCAVYPPLRGGGWRGGYGVPLWSPPPPPPPYYYGGYDRLNWRFNRYYYLPWYGGYRGGYGRDHHGGWHR